MYQFPVLRITKSRGVKIIREQSWERTGKTNLSRDSRERLPIQSRQHVRQQFRVRRQVLGDELGVLGMQREGGRGGLAGLDGAGEEVQG